MKALLTVLTLISLVAFGQSDKTVREGEPDIYNLSKDDKEMNDAVEKSRKTFNEFLTAFKNRKRNQTNFSVKMPFPTSHGAEHIWLDHIETKNGKLFGEVNNAPDNVPNLKLGDKVEIDRTKISDWFYIQDDKLVGGFTIRVIRNRMTPTERTQFDREFGVTF